MDRKYYYFLLVGAAIGLVLGIMWSAGRNLALGAGFGALIGLAVGWFAAAAATQMQGGNRNKP